MGLTFGSLFAGIGGFDLGLTRTGWHGTAQVEIDPRCREVLARHFPDARRHDDVTTASAATIGAVDLLCGGFPCQDLSVAGRRAGLAGARSGLFHEFMRLAAELAPRWVLIENVPGLLSSNGGGDMGVVLGTLGQLGYGWAYRSLDAQYFGLAQRRERVFIVGCLGDAARAAAVLFESASGGGDSPPRREAGEGTARRAAYSVAVRGRDDGQEWELGEPEVGNALRAGDGGSSRGNWAIVPPLAACKTRREGKGADSDATTTLIPTVSGPLGGRSGEGGFRQDLDTHGAYIPEIVGTLTGGTPGGTSHGKKSGTDRMPMIAHTLTGEGFDASEDGTGRGTPLVPISLHLTQDPISEYDFTPALGATEGSMGVLAFSENQRAETRLTDYARQITTGGGKPGQGYPAVLAGMAVRRLTPAECERLQGFPDGWTEGHSDSTRYRMLGNAVAVPCAEWIGRRILEMA